MNIYQKLQVVRQTLKDTAIKKSGLNSFAKYSYYELSDILPHITGVCTKYLLCPVVTFDNEIAKLTIYNSENINESIVFTSPMVESEVKGASKIQSLGATETYQRRYLYLIAFDIVEDDTNDKITTDLSLHSISSIKKRIEELLTTKMQGNNDMAQLYKKIGYDEKRFKSFMNIFAEIDRVEKELKKI